MTRIWPDSDNTQELIRGARDGEAEAVDRLLDRHREALRRVVALRLDRAIVRRVDASDIVQEVLIEANRRLDEYLAKPEMPFHLWLRRMAMDRLIDAHRRHRQAKRRSVDREQAPAAVAVDGDSAKDLLQHLVDHQLTPAASALREELAARFQVAIEELADADREIILLRHFEQLTNQEVADVLGLTEPAAGMRHLRALRRLRVLLDSEESSL